MKARYGLMEWVGCSEWAVNYLVKNEEQNDEEIILLASSDSDGEMKSLTENILQRYIPAINRNEEYWAGKYIVELHRLYFSKKIDIFVLEKNINNLYYKLGYPDWLVMLARNCEYATDVPAFQKPFEEEFDYIKELWRSSESIDMFNKSYDRQVSNSHDFKNC